MNKVETAFSVCPHDCPSACALDIQFDADGRVKRLHGAKTNKYTLGVICAKTARYDERLYHPNRLTKPLKRVGKKGTGEFQEISWDEALDEVASQFLKVEKEYGPESIWPYFYGGTMGLLQAGASQRIARKKGYSGFYETVCAELSYTGTEVAVGSIRGPDPTEVQHSDVIVIWGINAVSTQVNFITHAVNARKARGAKIVVIDTYENATAKLADYFLCLKPGTDGALACAVMHLLFKNGWHDAEYMAHYTDAPKEFEQHLKTKTPQWASDITGLSVEEIEAFAELVGTNKKSFFRLGFGFTRSRNGAVNMHAAYSIPTVTGAWKYLGGGALHTNSGIYKKFDYSLAHGSPTLAKPARALDQSRIGAILCGDTESLRGGPPVKAMIVQNTNPMVVTPDLNRVEKGLMRDDLFLCVHEQFMTDTAKLADIVLPATMFLEHDDLYKGGGHTHLMLGPKVVEPLGECRSNHEVISSMAERLGVADNADKMTMNELIDASLILSGFGDLEKYKKDRWIECQPDFDTAHFLNGFDHPDGKFHFRPGWDKLPDISYSPAYDHSAMPEFPDHWDVIDGATDTRPFRLVTAPARNFLNSTFTETPTSNEKEIRPTALIHPNDAQELGIKAGDLVELANENGAVALHAKLFEGLRKGVVICEGIWPRDKYVRGQSINVLTNAIAVAPTGGAALHDTSVSINKVSA